MRSRVVRLLVLPLVVAVAGMLAPPLAATAATPAPRSSSVVEPYWPGQEPLGQPWQVWTGRYFEWFQEIPVGKNPAVDAESPRNCEVQYGAVFMGPIGTGEDGCDVAEGRPIMLATTGWSCSTAEGGGRTWGALRSCARRSFHAELDDVRIRVALDGTELPHARRWTYGSTRRVATLPKNNLWGVEPGKTRFLGKAVVLMVRPPEPGNHVIRIRLREAGETTVLRYRFTVS